MDYLQIEQRGSARWLILNQPAKRNPLSRALLRALHSAIIDAADHDEIRCVVLAGDGPVFCAGADLTEFVQADDPAILAADGELLAQLLQAIAESPKPVIARVQGAALAGGAGLVAAADFAVATEDAQFGFTEIRIGLVPAVISPFVLRAIGRRATQRYFLNGGRFSAAEALRCGLISHVVPAHELDAAVDELVEALGQAAPGALGTVKQLLTAVEGLPFAAARDLTIQTLAERRASAEGQEGMRAFLEKRRPSWVSR